MKITKIAPLVIVGHDDWGNAFQARVETDKRIIVIHSIDKRCALHNVGTTSRIRLVVREALFKHGVILWPWRWLIIEVQLCFWFFVPVCKITGLRPFNHKSTRYEQLTEKETSLIGPVLHEIQNAV